MSAIDTWTDNKDLTVPRFVIERAVQALSNNKLEAIALIRGAFRDENKAWVPLKEAIELYKIITTAL